MQPAHCGLQMVQTARLPYYPRCFVARRFSALSLALARQCLWLRHASGCCWFGWLRQSKQTAIIYHHQNSQPQALLIQQVSSSITSMEQMLRARPLCQPRTMPRASHSVQAAEPSMSASRTSLAQKKIMPSPRSRVSVVADSPRNTPMPAIGIRFCARWCRRALRQRPAMRTLAASSSVVMLLQTMAVLKM